MYKSNVFLILFVVVIMGLITLVEVGKHEAVIQEVLSQEALTQEVQTADELIQEAELIVRCIPEEVIEERATGRMTPFGEITLYNQRMIVRETIKGPERTRVLIIWEGIEPLPPAGDPISLEYPGPLGEETEYVLFLRTSDKMQGYETIGRWQGVYPLDPDDRLVSLRGQGFAALQGLTVSELKEIVE